MSMKPRTSRRATILILVVSLLALLFVIVTGFLSLARVDRQMLGDVRQADLTDAILEDTDDWVQSLIVDQLAGDTGQLVGGGDAQSCSYEDIPGYRGSRWLAALEPVWDEGATHKANRYAPPPPPTNKSWWVLEFLCWPAVTSLDGSLSSPEPFALYELMRDYDFDDQALQVSDVQWNARNPFMDADGDGVPDSHFLLNASVIQAANAAASAPVSVPVYESDDAGGGDIDHKPFRIFQLPPAGSTVAADIRNHARWQRYDENARYDVAVRVVSHGGMVTLDAPTLYDSSGLGQGLAPFNREFSVDLFDAVRNSSDVSGMRDQFGYDMDDNRLDDLFDDLHANARAVEPLLRRRFLLPGHGERVGRQWRRQVPPVLAKLQGERSGWQGFPWTFLPQIKGVMLAGMPPNDWQRVNIGVDVPGGDQDDERLKWSRSVSLRATEYDDVDHAPKPEVLLKGYDRRHLITTVNYSDELARKQVQNDPQPSSARPLDLNEDRGSTYQGELKFYLGEVAKAFREVNPDTGQPQSDSGCYSYDPLIGNVIIERLARIYFDMLGGHDEWSDVKHEPNDPSDSGKEAVSLRQQAFMLAVNTVAFAAPRSTNESAPGFVPVVSYSDTRDPTVLNWVDNPRGNGMGANNLRYVGYSAQPFLTEAIAYTDDPADPNDPNDPNGPKATTAVAVELYNPSDPYYDDSTDVHGRNVDVFRLWLGQLGVSVGGEVGTVPARLTAATPGPLNGRSFAKLVLKESGGENDHFDSIVADALPDEPSILTMMDIDDPDSGPFSVVLWRWDWRYDNNGNPVQVWFPIDEIEIDPGVDSTPGRIPEEGYWNSAYRDTSPNRFLGGRDEDGDGIPDDLNKDGKPDYPRWNIVTRTKRNDSSGDPDDPNNVASKDTPQKVTVGKPAWLAYGQQSKGVITSPDFVGVPSVAFSPTTPLITMNAGPPAEDSLSLYQRFNNLPMFGNTRDLRPRSFPTVGFMLFIPRFSHVHRSFELGAEDALIPMSEVLAREWNNRGYSNAVQGLPASQYPADFGHMPIFDNTQPVVGKSYLDDVGDLPWGLLVFDYFTTLDPLQDRNGDGQPDIDPLRVPGRININTAPWYVLANLPMLGPVPNGHTGVVPVVPLDGEVTPAYPSPSFWAPVAGTLNGAGLDGNARLLCLDVLYTGDKPGTSMPYYDPDTANLRYRLGPWLAQSAGAYRDGIQYVANTADRFQVYSNSHDRNVSGGVYSPYRDLARYGTVRGRATAAGGRPTEFGFISVGELLNVKGFDSSTDVELRTVASNGAASADTSVARGDFIKAVSLLALLDTQYLTTRSNTFTIYTSVMDREDPESSMRSQVTLDRSNLLPRLTYAFYDPQTGRSYPVDAYLNEPAVSTLPMQPLLLDLKKGAGGQPGKDEIPETPVRMTNEGARPQVIAKERGGYFNARYDD